MIFLNAVQVVLAEYKWVGLGFTSVNRWGSVTPRRTFCAAGASGTTAIQANEFPIICHFICKDRPRDSRKGDYIVHVLETYVPRSVDIMQNAWTLRSCCPFSAPISRLIYRGYVYTISANVAAALSLNCVTCTDITTGPDV